MSVTQKWVAVKITMFCRGFLLVCVTQVCLGLQKTNEIKFTMLFYVFSIRINLIIRSRFNKLLLHKNDELNGITK